MEEVPRISVEEARRKVRAGAAVLVCAYAEEAKCNQMKLEGSINLSDLESRLPSVRKDQEVILYCA